MKQIKAGFRTIPILQRYIHSSFPGPVRKEWSQGRIVFRNTLYGECDGDLAAHPTSPPHCPCVYGECDGTFGAVLPETDLRGAGHGECDGTFAAEGEPHGEVPPA